MHRIRQKDLENLINELNEKTNSPMTPWTKTADGFNANIGNHHLYYAYGSVGVHRMINEGGGVCEIIGLGTKRETYDKLRFLFTGISYT